MKQSNYFLLLLFCIILLQACQNDDYNKIIEDNKTEANPYKISPEEATQTALEFMKSIKENFATRNASFDESRLHVSGVEAISLGKNKTRSLGYDIDIDTLMYAVNFGDNGGYAIVSADNRTDPVYAIIDNGTFTQDKLTSDNGLTYFLEHAIESMLTDIKENTESGSATRALSDWETMLLGFPKLSVNWGQGYPYNMYCPNDYTGCVAVATAQILSYYRTIGSVRWSYNNTSGSAVLNWNRIIQDSQANNGKLTMSNAPQSSMEVAHLMRYLGVALDADYKSGSTSIDSDKAIKWMRNWGGLSAGSLKKYDSNAILQAFSNLGGGLGTGLIFNNKLVYARGNSGRKKVLGITVSYSGGHAWVIDAAMMARNKNDGKFYHLVHCNWGWSGSDNGYYKSGVFDTNAGPEFTRGTSGNYKYNQEYSIIEKI